MKQPAEILGALAVRKERIVCGLMSGTSADSIDVAICRITGSGFAVAENPGAKVDLLFFEEFPMPSGLSECFHRPDSLTLKDIAELDIMVAEAFSEAVIQSVERAGMGMQDVDLIGSHGQTVYHHSRRRDARRATLQLGNGDVIARRLGVPVVSNFRVKDIAEGGEGAPLTPYADLILYGSAGLETLAILNLGGIANITVPAIGAGVIGFDSGPANAPLDRAARRFTAGKLAYDIDGKIAASGSVDQEVLAIMKEEDSYHRLSPPKSTGFETYGDCFVDRAVELHGSLDNSLLSTILQFVVWTIGDAFRRFVLPSCEVRSVILAGGGARNPELVRRLSVEISPLNLVQSGEVGVPGDAREAMAFAVLANDALFGLPTSLPSVTGASRAVSLGVFSFP